MRIAIIGAGFSGVATAWHLLSLAQKHQIALTLTLFDSKGIGGEASGIAAGLLHCYAGAHAKLNRMGKEGMEAAKQLLSVASHALGKSVASYCGILRLALTEAQKQDYHLCAQKHPSDVQWLDSDHCQQLVPGIASAPGIFIPDGIAVASSVYLKGLWLACQQRGAEFKHAPIHSFEELNEFDIKIAALGAGTKPFRELAHLPISQVKGQILELEWPQSLPPLKVALNAHAYIVMNENQKTCIAGATFERGTMTPDPDIEAAKAEILPHVIAMLPALATAKVIGCEAGIRVVTPTHLPLLEHIGNQCWALTGMGSKGLLYHALMAQRLAHQILENTIA
jgi:glycine/D-amino acid oxidase-like deaminating enzyme